MGAKRVDMTFSSDLLLGLPLIDRDNLVSTILKINLRISGNYYSGCSDAGAFSCYLEAQDRGSHLCQSLPLWAPQCCAYPCGFPYQTVVPQGSHV